MAMLGTKENPVEVGEFQTRQTGGYTKTVFRSKLPRGWILQGNNEYSFIPFAEDGTGWGKNDPTDLSGD